VSSLRRAVFLDRDGVLNEPVVRGGVPHPPESLEDLVVTPETEEACRAFKGAGLLLIVVTNQPDLARGTRDRNTVDAINDELRRRLGLDDVLVCPHDDADGCPCRKPQPGLLLDAASRWNVGLGGSVMVGDRWRDVEAGRRAGCSTVLVRRDYDERAATGANHVVDDLREAVPWILRSIGPGTAGGIH
jgi:D-glycero-D-manno-heptose 1,7-bisphosphate phosphatase